LTWDSRHFGFLVGRLSSQELTDEQLSTNLQQAKSMGFRLVYWFASKDRFLEPALLARFSGVLASRRANFRWMLNQRSVDENSRALQGIQIRLYPAESASDELIELGLLAGQYSRFQSDARIPRERFVELFRCWTERSTQREIADAVFVAEADQQIVGFVTAKKDQQIGTIGLIATNPHFHRRGIGKLLLGHAHRWMLKHDIVEAQVSTQVENFAACQLYLRTGYQLASLESVYHFWPQG
jgi:GNAT superfamily N-acetyltransferase